MSGCARVQKGERLYLRVCRKLSKARGDVNRLPRFAKPANDELETNVWKIGPCEINFGGFVHKMEKRLSLLP